MNFGIMGPGRIAHSFCGGMRELNSSNKVLAVASKSSLERAESFAKEENIEIFYQGYDKLLNNPDIDVVYIATTHNFHYENIIACLNANKHVICEKPMVLTENEAVEVTKMAKEKGLFLMEAMWSRFLPKTIKIREWVKEGRIGDVKLAQGTIGFVAPVDYSDRFYNKELAAGTLYDMGIYLIDLLPYFANQTIEDISAESILTEDGVDLSMNITMKTSGGIASGQATVLATVPEDAYIYGSKGYIKVPHIHYGTDAILYDENRNEVEHFDEHFDFGFKYEIQEVIDCIEAGKLESDIASHQMTIENAQIYDKLITW